MKKRYLYTIIAVSVVVGVFAGVMLAGDSGPGRLTPDRITTTQVAQALPSPAFASTENGGMLADIVSDNINSVVSIYSRRVIKVEQDEQNIPGNNPFYEWFFGPNSEMPREREQEGQGSGVIISSDGIVLTNNHVVENAEELKVTLYDENIYDAEIVGTDPKSDLAVIRLTGDIEELDPIPLGDSDALRLGDVVLAIGNPFGLSHTVTMGIVSAKARGNMGIVDYENFIQTDAAINPGNSGGALINTNGELVGINTAILSTGRMQPGYQGVGFAIPSNMANVIKDKLIENGKIVRGFLGVGIQKITHDLANAMDLPTTDGVLVTEVHEGSPAAKADIETGDVITSVNGMPVNNPNMLRNRIAMLGADADVELGLIRDGDRLEKTATLTTLPGENQMAQRGGTNRGRQQSGDLNVAPLSSQYRQRFSIPESINEGVVVTQVAPDSPIHNAGIVVGDVIRQINGENVTGPEDFMNKYRNASGTVILRVYRNGGHFFLPVDK